MCAGVASHHGDLQMHLGRSIAVCEGRPACSTRVARGPAPSPSEIADPSEDASEAAGVMYYGCASPERARWAAAGAAASGCMCTCCRGCCTCAGPCQITRGDAGAAAGFCLLLLRATVTGLQGRRHSSSGQLLHSSLRASTNACPSQPRSKLCHRGGVSLIDSALWSPICSAMLCLHP